MLDWCIKSLTGTTAPGDKCY